MAEAKHKGTKRTPRDASDPPSPESLPSLPPAEGFIPPHGGYESLLAYQKSLVIYDATLHFCNRFVDQRSRTHDQMVQAARSGKQNILEGSEASGTSKETEIKLTGVARASLKELLEDYRDFMRNRGIEEWDPNHRYALRLRRLNRTPGANYATFRKGVEHPDPAICANVIAGLIKVTTYLLDRQLKRLEQDFLKEPERSNLAIQNTLRRILENYFKILGGIEFDDLCAMFDGKEKLICKSLCSCVHDGSHYAYDDLYVSIDDSMVDSYLKVFRAIFDRSGHSAHYKMMMADAFVELPAVVAAPAAVPEPTPSPAA